MLEELYKALRTVREDGVRAFQIDREKAFQWYSQQGFPSHDPNTVVGLDVYRSLSEKADHCAVWKEAWAGFHQVLLGALAQGKEEHVPPAVWRIGRAHMGLEESDLSALFLDAARQLTTSERDVLLWNAVLLDSAVLGKMTDDTSRFDAALARLAYKGSATCGDNLPELSQLADSIQVQATRNSKWADRTGQWTSDTLKLSLAQSGVSLALNRKLGREAPVGFVLSNMADIQRKLGATAQARELYMESIAILSRCGALDAVRVLRERLAAM
jgi:hypothetical protein